MLERPYDAVDDELLVFWRNLEQSAEAVRVDCLQEAEELQTVLREVLNIRSKSIKTNTHLRFAQQIIP